MSIVRVHHPRHVLIHIGGNDLDSNGGDVQERVFKLITFASTITDTFDVSSVTICHVAPRKYNGLVKEANTLLKKELKGKQIIHYWKITGVKNATVEIYEDGVHFNISHGMPRYYRNIRGAIIQTII